VVCRAGMHARRPHRRSPAIVACRGGCRESMNKGLFLALLLPFAPPDKKYHPPSSISTTSWLRSSSSSPSSFLIPFSCF